MSEIRHLHNNNMSASVVNAVEDFFMSLVDAMAPFCHLCIATVFKLNLS